MSVGIEPHRFTDSYFQQEVRETPDIVEEHREHEVEHSHSVILRRGLRYKVVLDRLVLVLDLPPRTVPTTYGLGLLSADAKVCRESSALY